MRKIGYHSFQIHTYIHREQLTNAANRSAACGATYIKPNAAGRHCYRRQPMLGINFLLLEARILWTKQARTDPFYRQRHGWLLLATSGNDIESCTRLLTVAGQTAATDYHGVGIWRGSNAPSARVLNTYSPHFM